MAETEKTIQAIAVSPGIAIGRILRVDRSGRDKELRRISEAQVADELALLQVAIELTRRQLTQLRDEVRDKLRSADAEIFDAHLLLLEDKMLLGDVENRITKELLSAKSALYSSADHFGKVFEGMSDEYLRERAADLRDVVARLADNLTPEKVVQANDTGDRRIIIANTLTPSETVRLDKKRVLGFAVVTGSATSHTAILARSMQIPAIVGIPAELLETLDPTDRVIVDGYSGKFIINPDDRTEEAYRTKIRSTGKLIEELAEERGLLPITRDGFEVELAVNLESADQYEEASKAGAQGVGLFRTEFLFMDRLHIPDEEEQFQIYKKLLLAAGDAPVTIRTMDLGGDKINDTIYQTVEDNPFLGLRGIRLALYERRDLFDIQIRALLRAGIYGNLRVMLPMVSSIREVLYAKRIISELQQQLEKEGKEYLKRLTLGVMVETPAAALMADNMADLVDFFSIGTNDLVQYTMAIDRGNERVAYLYQPSHPAILRLIRNVVEAARAHNIYVCVCGQMASEPIFAPLLLGLGVAELSLAPSALAAVRRVIRSISLHEAERAAEEALRCSHSGETIDIFHELLTKRAPEIAGIQD